MSTESTDYMDQANIKGFRNSMEITYCVIACNRIYTNNLLYCNVFVSFLTPVHLVSLTVIDPLIHECIACFCPHFILHG